MESPLERAEWWRDPHLGDLDLLRATFVTHTYPRHMHDEFVIGVIEDGVQGFTYRGTNHTTPTGGLFILNPAEAHTGYAAVATGYTYRVLYPSAALLQRAASNLVDRPRDVPFFSQAVIDDRTLARLLRRLHRSLETRYRGSSGSRACFGRSGALSRAMPTRGRPRARSGRSVRPSSGPAPTSRRTMPTTCRWSASRPSWVSTPSTFYAHSTGRWACRRTHTWKASVSRGQNNSWPSGSRRPRSRTRPDSSTKAISLSASGRVGFNIIYGLFRAAHRFVRTLYLTITVVTLASDARLPACGAVQSAMYRCSTAFSAAG